MSIKILMAGNYINHHQIPLCNALYAELGKDFVFVQTEEMEEARAAMGWQKEEGLPYVMYSYREQEKVRELTEECELLILGWVRDIEPFMGRLRSGKPALRISERIYREGQWKFLSPRGLVNKYREHTILRRLPVGLLCCGVYTASDFRLIGAYPNRRYNFGYFPHTRRYESFQQLWSKKSPLTLQENPDEKKLLPGPSITLTANPVDMVWAGRMVALKHPEMPVKLAAELVKRGYRFHIHMIGDGPLREAVEGLACEELVEDYFTFYGFMRPEEVRNIMEGCHIHLFNSNFLEGWGTVVNESMNAGCVPVAGSEAGAVYSLIDDGVNGLIYQNNDFDSFLDRVVSLLEAPDSIPYMAEKAYNTIVEEWNGEVAARRIIEYFRAEKEHRSVEYSSGPLSAAVLMHPGFFKTGKLE